MSSRPTAAEIAWHNAWALANGEPPMAAPAAPVAPPPAPPAAAPTVGAWRAGTQVQGQRVYARRANGEQAVVRFFSERENRWIVTAAGREYYREHRSQYIVNIPLVGYTYIKASGTYVLATVNRIPGGEPLRRTYVLNEDTEESSPEAALEAIQRQAEAFVASRQRIQTVDGLFHWLEMKSDLFFCYVGGDYTFDELTVQHVDAQGVPDFEVLQDRPLRGKPLLWEHMYRRMGLCPLACADLGEGNCVVKQLALRAGKLSEDR